ncbi:hypothetical protein C8F04DRAFT_126479 [Mycena alexandri]|uniref:F-box domain-containing protein n=1 Tax=Mycena alexandri TaxID=1745969 RepID=A0AAD6SHW3_9AGAR|nr:hypothetical protein C8F04DRAFT_126479 [Mycena alexandri]
MVARIASTRSSDGRRRLKSIFQLPLFPHSHTLARNPTANASALGPDISLPADIFREIADLLGPNDLLSVSLTSSLMRALLKPDLYKTVHLRSSRSCQSGLDMLWRNPDLCSYIQKLAVRPNYYLAWPARDVPMQEGVVVELICKIAKNLTNLRTFDWDGLDMPPRDELWLTLRTSCPELKELFSNVGFQPLDPASELFKFNDLSIFSLSIRHGLGDTEIFPTPADLPAQLWDMLLHRCPNLTELTLCSFSASHRLFAVGRVTEGRWPALRSLTLGAFGYNSDFTLAAPPAAPFATFLAAHQTLTYLRLAWNFKRWMSPNTDDIFSIAFPQSLDAFSGIAQQLQTSSAPLLTSLDLMCEPLYTERAEALRTALQAMPLLSSLELWVHVPEPRAGHEAFFRDLWSATPGLEDLHFMCTTAFGKKPLAELARALRLLPKLHTFALTKGHRYADESMRRSAQRVFGALNTRSMSTCTQSTAETTRLAQVSIRWARAACRNHLKQEGTYERILPPPKPVCGKSCAATDVQVPSRTRGEGEGEQVMVGAWERGLRAVGGAFDRRYRFPLTQKLTHDTASID